MVVLDSRVVGTIHDIARLRNVDSLSFVGKSLRDAGDVLHLESHLHGLRA